MRRLVPASVPVLQIGGCTSHKQQSHTLQIPQMPRLRQELHFFRSKFLAKLSKKYFTSLLFHSKEPLFIFPAIVDSQVRCHTKCRNIRPWSTRYGTGVQVVAKTLAQELAEVESAITAVLGGAQSYTDNDGQTIVYPSLFDLRQMRRELKTEIVDSSPMEQRVAEFG